VSTTGRPRSAAPTALVTGASSGIGRALASCFAASGHRLVLVARGEAALEEVAQALREAHGVAVDVIATDLACPGAPAALAQALRRRRRPIDVLVNCAGVVRQDAFVAQDAAAHQRLVDLNVSALTAMLAAFVPGMVARGAGRVLNVASIAAFHPAPGLAVYAASKAFVLSLTESLAEELRGTGVTATVLCPGITATAMLDRASARRPSLRELPSALVGDADEVAEAGHRACLAGEVVVVPGAINRAIAVAARLAPQGLVREVAGFVAERLD